jgi:hypothetical protein
MPSPFENDVVDMKVDVGVLKEQVKTITSLCNKMDQVIDKLVDNQEKLESQIYADMDRRKKDTTEDIKELHSRITTTDRNLADKIELTERRLMEEIKQLRKDINDHNSKEDEDLKKILEWKWMAAGGIIVITWLLSHIKFGIIEKLLN